MNGYIVYLRIDIIIKYLIIILCVVGMFFPMFNNNLDNLSSKASIYSFLTKKYTTNKQAE